MDLHEAHHRVSDLEQRLGPESSYRPILERLIADLMDMTFESTDKNEKIQLASLEMRARLVCEQWLVAGKN